MEELSKDELWEIYENLPESLKDAVFSEDTSEVIWNICKMHKIENVSGVAKLVGRVLMGLLPPDLFEQALAEQLGIEAGVSQEMASELEHYIFSPVKDDLDFLYEDEGGSGIKEKQEASRPQQKTKEEDAYREPID